MIIEASGLAIEPQLLRYQSPIAENRPESILTGSGAAVRFRFHT
jgi:hypothetical protein